MRLRQFQTEVSAAVDQLLEVLLPEPFGPEGRLFEAMRYAAIGGGKRLRPLLVVASSDLFAVSRFCAERVAVAVELVHAYSLVHDDLPCMDDDDIRRGRPTVHRAFDEATAVLAGDALLTLAFEVLASPQTHGDAEVRSELVRALAHAAGGQGMTGGQMIDLLAAGQALDLGGVARLQQMKTGALIAFACEAGAILGKGAEPPRLALRAYARDIGLAFQIADDLLDVEGSEIETGKGVRKDAEAGKATLVTLLGVDQARMRARMLAQQAVAHLDLFAEKADVLRELAAFVVDRRS